MSNEMNRRQLLILGGALAAGVCLAGSMTFAGEAESVKVDVGPIGDFTGAISEKFAKSGGVFMVKEGNKLFAVSATCTHRKALLKAVDGQLRCPAHGSRFSLNGHCEKGPATGTLPRFAVSKDAAGHVIVDKSKTFDEKQWDDPASYVAVS